MNSTGQASPTDEALLAGLDAWGSRYGEIPAEYQPEIAAYLKTIRNIPDKFDDFSGQLLRDVALEAVQTGESPAIAVDCCVRATQDILNWWFRAFDRLDADLRGADGRLPDWADPITRGIALELFQADSALKTAVIDYHHGSVGLNLDPAYGFEYALANGTVSPFQRP